MCPETSISLDTTTCIIKQRKETIHYLGENSERSMQTKTMYWQCPHCDHQEWYTKDKPANENRALRKLDKHINKQHGREQ